MTSFVGLSGLYLVLQGTGMDQPPDGRSLAPLSPSSDGLLRIRLGRRDHEVVDILDRKQLRDGNHEVLGGHAVRLDSLNDDV